MHAADNVGDNVGDIAGMGADLFGSFAESTCAALVISSVSSLGQDHFYSSMSYPLLISGAGIIICLLTTFVATDLRPARMVSEIENTLKYQLIISTLLATPVRPPAILLPNHAISAALLCTHSQSSPQPSCYLSKPPARLWLCACLQLWPVIIICGQRLQACHQCGSAMCIVQLRLRDNLMTSDMSRSDHLAADEKRCIIHAAKSK
jgi:hypothetical protein